MTADDGGEALIWEVMTGKLQFRLTNAMDSVIISMVLVEKMKRFAIASDEYV